MQVDLYLSPVAHSKPDLSRRTVVVIDVLRCTTSINTALRAGAKGVIPVLGPGEAADVWTKIGSDMAVLAGERQGVRIENFLLGNSPAEFTEETVAGKFVIMTTTNGTMAFVNSQPAARIFSASLTNISTVAQAVASAGDDLAVVCAGREGHFSIEDTICGGMLIHLLAAEHKIKLEFNDASSLALLLYRTNSRAIGKAIAQGEHGRFLISIGFEHDVRSVAEIDSVPVLPVLKDGRLVLENE